jgi:hypothetical protein
MKIALINAEGSAVSVDIEVYEVVALAEAFGFLPQEIEQDTQLNLWEMLNNLDTNPFLPMAVETIENTGNLVPYEPIETFPFPEEDEGPAFNVGNRVEVVASNRFGVPIGFIGTIDEERDSDNEYWVRFDDELWDSSHVDYVAEDALGAYFEPEQDEFDFDDFEIPDEVEFPHFINVEEVKVIAEVMGNFTPADTSAIGVDPEAHHALFDALDDIAEAGKAALLSDVEAQIVVATLGNAPVNGETFPTYNRLYEAVKEALGTEPIMERMRALAGVRPLIGAGA